MESQQVNLILNQIINRLRTGLEQSWQSIIWQLRQSIHHQKLLLQSITNQNENTKQIVATAQHEIKQIIFQLTHIVETNLKNEIQSIEILSQSLQIYNPKRVLAMGYAIVTQNNQAIEKSSNFNPKQKTTLQWQDGKIEL